MGKIKRLAIYGKSGHGKVITDIALLNGYNEILYIDDDLSKNNVISYENFKVIYKDVEVIVAIGINTIREKVFEQLSIDGFKHTTLIHPSAILSPSSSILEGSVVMAGVVVNADAKIGRGVILNTSCIIEHDNIIEDFVHISPNVALAGNVSVANRTHIGIGSSVIQGICIGSDVTVGAGSVVVQDIKDNCIAYGVPAKIQ